MSRSAAPAPAACQTTLPCRPTRLGRPGLNCGAGWRRALSVAALCALALPLPAFGFSLALPAGAERTADEPLTDGIQLPVGAMRDGAVPRAEFTGEVRRQAWRLPGTLSTLSLTARLREQLDAAGWEILADCETEACGGFDFRFALAVLPEPAMHVDLGDFRYLAARSDAGLVAALASRRGETGYLQITMAAAAGPEGSGPPAGDSGGGAGEAAGDGTGAQAGPGSGGPVLVSPVTPALPAGAGYQPGALGATLESLGHVVLDDLDFGTGSAELGAGPHPSLVELAGYLAAHPGRKVALVGHTDATGGLEVNQTVSRRRAQSVLERLASGHGVNRAQISAAGIGYLAPLYSNLTETGRSANRRVEVVLLSVE